MNRSIGVCSSYFSDRTEFNSSNSSTLVSYEKLNQKSCIRRTGVSHRIDPASLTFQVSTSCVDRYGFHLSTMRRLRRVGCERTGTHLVKERRSAQGEGRDGRDEEPGPTGDASERPADGSEGPAWEGGREAGRTPAGRMFGVWSGREVPRVDAVQGDVPGVWKPDAEAVGVRGDRGPGG